MVIPLPILKAPFVNRLGLELFIVVFASPKVITEAAFPKGPFAADDTAAPFISVPALMVVVPV